MNCTGCGKAISGAYEAGSYSCSGCGAGVEINPTEEWQNTGRPVTWEEAQTLTIDEAIEISRGPMPPAELCQFFKMSGRWCGEPAITPGRCKRHSPKLSTRLEAIREGKTTQNN